MPLSNESEAGDGDHQEKNQADDGVRFNFGAHGVVVPLCKTGAQLDRREKS